jgi:hypothetical protein
MDLRLLQQQPGSAKSPDAKKAIPQPPMLCLTRLPGCGGRRTIHVFPPGHLPLGSVGFQRGRSGALESSFLVVRFFLNCHGLSMTQRGIKIEVCR